MQTKRETYRRERKNKASKVEVLTEAQKIAFAPMTFQTLAALIDFNILQAVSETPMTREQVMEKCNLPKYTVFTLFDAALCAGILQKDEDGLYSAAPLGEAFLFDPMTKANFNFVKDVCYLGAHELKESFEKNAPAGLQKHHINSKTIYEVLPQLPEQMLKSWYEFDHYYSDDCFGEVLKIMFNPRPAKVFDIGGNTGKFERACLAFDSECEVNMIDLPPNIEVARADFGKCGVEYTQCTSEHVPCKSSTECDLRKQIETECKNFELPIIQDTDFDGHAVAQPQCPCEGLTFRESETSKFKTADFDGHAVALDRLKFHALDILKQENNLPDMTAQSDSPAIVLMSQFLDCFSEEQILRILNKVGERINEHTRVYILEPFIDNQFFAGAAYALSHISLYFTCMANGCSKMYNEADMKDIIRKSNLKVNKAYYNIGKYDYTLLECVKA